MEEEDLAGASVKAGYDGFNKNETITNEVQSLMWWIWVRLKRRPKALDCTIGEIRLMPIRMKYLIRWVTVGAEVGIVVGVLMSASVPEAAKTGVVLAVLIIGGAAGAAYQITRYGL